MSPEDASSLESAIQFALKAHAGQRDKSNAPYILHLLSVMDRVDSPIQKQAAVLHDVLEDTAATVEDLSNAGIHPDAIAAVVVLTHRPGTSYSNYVIKLSENPIASIVKLADLNDNYRLERVAYRRSQQLNDIKRIQRYILSKQFLTSEINEMHYREAMQTVDADAQQ